MSEMPSFGATPAGDGRSTTFRLWAPNAQAVAIRIDPFSRVPTDVPMASEPAGHTWRAETDRARAASDYVYLITTATGQSVRVDPFAVRTRDDGQPAQARSAVVYDDDAFAWSAAWQEPGWTQLVIYELHVGSFDPARGEQIGTFDDVIGRLGYLGELGINAIELLPVAGFEGAVSWGYDPGVPFGVANAYGGPEALKRLVDAAHQQGIAILLDVVYNHFGPEDSILWQFDGSGDGWEGGIYFYGTRFPDDGRPQTPWGSRPDYGRSEVRAYLVANAVSRVQSFRLDGLRFDATAYIRSVDGSGAPGQEIPDGWRLLQEINDAIAQAQPWKFTVAEDMRGESAITGVTAGGGAGFDAQWDPDFVVVVRGVLEQIDDADRSMAALSGVITQRLGPRAISRVIFTESHDADGNGRTRVPAEIDPLTPDSWWARKRSTLGAALVMTVPGVPMLFQGQEFLEARPFLQDPPSLDWQDADTYAPILALYRDLIHARRDWDGHCAGLRGDAVDVFHVNDIDKVIAYHRYDQGGPGDDVLVIVNAANRGYDAYTIGLPRAGTWAVRFNSDSSAYGFGNWAADDLAAADSPRDGLPFSGAVGIGPYTALILSQDR